MSVTIKDAYFRHVSLINTYIYNILKIYTTYINYFTTIRSKDERDYNIGIKLIVTEYATLDCSNITYDAALHIIIKSESF